MKILFIGGGNMASALIGGLIARGAPPADLAAVDPLPAQRQALAARFGIATHASAAGAAASADVLVLAVKPQQMREAVDGLRDAIAGRLLLSVAAGVRAADLSRWLGGYARIVRTMPNTPALIGLGVTGLAALPAATAGDREAADRIMKAVGDTVWVDDESQLDAVTAVSGSGPAYVFRFIEAMVEGGERLGLSRDQAMRLTLRTFVGAAELAARSDEAPSALRERVTSKGGTTAAALAVMEARDIGGTIGAALEAACRRSNELGREFGGD